MHGDLLQKARDRAIERFKSDAPPVLVATDIASRGLDIDEITHVVNYELPQEPDVYVHRIGRTGRAGATGTAVSFVDLEERSELREIEKLTRQKIRVEPVPATVPTLGQLLRGEVADAEGKRPAAPVKQEPVVHTYGGFASHKHAPARRRRRK
jgi:superfamily II DNA/RNA helicase